MPGVSVIDSLSVRCYLARTGFSDSPRYRQKQFDCRAPAALLVAPLLAADLGDLVEILIQAVSILLTDCGVTEAVRYL